MIDATAEDPLSTSLVAETAGSPIGMAYCRLDAADRSVGQLFAMWVDPGHRGLSAGRALLHFALSWMHERGATNSELTVTETNAAAIRLYKAAGYVDTGDRQVLREGSSLQVIKMRRGLESVNNA